MRKSLIKLGVVAGLLTGVVSMTPSTLQAYARCSTYNGTACPTPDEFFVCYNRYPDEPGICYCAGGVWECG